MRVLPKSEVFIELRQFMMEDSDMTALVEVFNLVDLGGDGELLRVEIARFLLQLVPNANDSEIAYMQVSDPLAWPTIRYNLRLYHLRQSHHVGV